MRARLEIPIVVGALSAMTMPSAVAEVRDLTRAVIVTRDASVAHAVESTAASVLAEEIASRTGLRWRVQSSWPASGWAVVVAAGVGSELHGRIAPASATGLKPEGYCIHADMSAPGKPVLWVLGADPRGALYGVGRMLRSLECRAGSVRMADAIEVATSPRYPIRGHQLGYRATANSYDAWTPEQYDRYIRELAFFGTNAVENIPGQDERPTVSGFPRDKMNVEISRICGKYGLDHWIWTPAAFDLQDEALRSEALATHERLFRDLPVLTGVFVPGGDPGDNPPELVIPYLADLARLLGATHPRARVWLSMQGYDRFEQDTVYRWIEKERPAWLGGIVAGPSSPPLADIRARLPRPYAIRDYPDITHSVRCQFPVPWWDPAFAFTLGRECVNPRPVFHARIVRDTMPFTDGFISYSDGVHDDLNKVLWGALAWDPGADLNAIVADYCRLFFGPDVAGDAASGLFALERNWEGALATNGSVDATFRLWQDLEKRAPQLKGSWRWQLYLLRANYDLYTRRRLLYESALETEANRRLLTARGVGSERAAEAALATLARATKEPIEAHLRDRVATLCDDLFRSIGLQTSVAKYKASGPERGAVLDFVDYPLNNRWWLEDEIARARSLTSEDARVRRLEQLARWEDPGPGSFYDDIGNVAKSPREVRNERLASPILDMDHMMTASFMWWVGDSPNARVRQSWISYEDWPEALRYPTLDPEADYVLRVAGNGDCFPRANGARLTPTVYGKELGAIKEFPIPRGLHRDGSLTITFDATFEPHLNWRQQSRVCEVWLIRR